jgi:hypothetical protein
MSWTLVASIKLEYANSTQTVRHFHSKHYTFFQPGPLHASDIMDCLVKILIYMIYVKQNKKLYIYIEKLSSEEMSADRKNEKQEMGTEDEDGVLTVARQFNLVNRC